MLLTLMTGSRRRQKLVIVLLGVGGLTALVAALVGAVVGLDVSNVVALVLVGIVLGWVSLSRYGRYWLSNLDRYTER